MKISTNKILNSGFWYSYSVEMRDQNNFKIIQKWFSGIAWGKIKEKNIRKEKEIINK